MPIATRGVSELVIEAKDLAASERFYTLALGLPIVLRWEGEAWTGREAVWVQSGEQTKVGLWKPAAADQRRAARSPRALRAHRRRGGLRRDRLPDPRSRRARRRGLLWRRPLGTRYALGLHARSRRPPRGNLDPEHRHPHPSRRAAPSKSQRSRPESHSVIDWFRCRREPVSNDHASGALPPVRCSANSTNSDIGFRADDGATHRGGTGRARRQTPALPVCGSTGKSDPECSFGM